MKTGNVIIPFYPNGYADNAIVHIAAGNEEKWSIVINKHLKEPRVVPDYITFENSDL